MIVNIFLYVTNVLKVILIVLENDNLIQIKEVYLLKYYIKIYSEKDLLNTGWKWDNYRMFKTGAEYDFNPRKIDELCGKTFTITKREYDMNIDSNGVYDFNTGYLNLWYVCKRTAILFTREV